MVIDGTRWNGLIRECRKVWVTVGGAVVEAVEVDVENWPLLFIADDHGQGWSKVTDGLGHHLVVHEELLPDEGSAIDERDS